MHQLPPNFHEAIVVLANLMTRDGELNSDSLARLELAATLLAQKPKCCLITSGWNYRPDSSIKIAHAMRDTARDRYGVPADRIIADTSARDTVGDALFVKRNILEPSGMRQISVVSSGYHIARVREIFEFIFGPAFELTFNATTVDHAARRDDLEIASLKAFRSTFEGVAVGDTEAIFQRLVQSHPRYNGVEFPAFQP